MKKKQIPASFILDGIAKCIQDYLLHYTKPSTKATTLEEFAKSHPYFCFNGTHYFCFSTRKEFTGTGMENISMYHVDSAGKRDFWYLRVATFKRVFPFMEFQKGMHGDWNSGWYESKQLFDLLPTRKSIIDNLLKEL